MTSMIDVVFLLLIYFLTTSQFSATERNLDPAIRVQAMRADEESQELDPVIVEVRPIGEVLGGQSGGFEYRIGGRRLSTPDELAEVLDQLPSHRLGAFVRVAGGIPFAAAASALQACESAGFAEVTYVPIDETNDTANRP